MHFTMAPSLVVINPPGSQSIGVLSNQKLERKSTENLPCPTTGIEYDFGEAQHLFGYRYRLGYTEVAPAKIHSSVLLKVSGA